MFSYKILSLFAVLLVAQAAFGKTIDAKASAKLEKVEVEYRKDPSVQKQFVVYTFDHMVALAEPYADNAAKVCHNILNDEEFKADDKPEVVEFKKKLELYLEKYEDTKNLKKVWEYLDIYDDAVDYYFDLPEKKKTPEAQFIIDMLNKYEARNVEATYIRQFNEFNTKFMAKFEEEKEHFDSDLIDWYDSYKELTDFEQKFVAMLAMIVLA